MKITLCIVTIVLSCLVIADIVIRCVNHDAPVRKEPFTIPPEWRAYFNCPIFYWECSTIYFEEQSSVAKLERQYTQGERFDCFIEIYTTTSIEKYIAPWESKLFRIYYAVKFLFVASNTRFIYIPCDGRFIVERVSNSN